MEMNRVQFQHGLSLADFLKRYGTGELCESHVVASRWPEGFVCSRCSSKRYAMSFNGRRIRECLDCGYQCSSIVGTVFGHIKLRLTQWFLGVYLMTQSKNAVAGLELMRQLDVSYKTAWLVRHQLMQTMLVRQAPRRLTDRVKIDHAYLGGERVGEKPGRGSPNKVPFVAAVQTDLAGKPHLMRLTPVAGFTEAALTDRAALALAPGANVVSDGLGCFEAVTTVAQTTHERHVVGAGSQAVKRPEFRWVNTMPGNLKTAFAGTYHALDYARYAHRYLAEFAYRFNRRYDLPAIVLRLIHAAMHTAPLPRHALCLSEAGN